MPREGKPRHKTHGPELTAADIKFCLALIDGKSRYEAYTTAGYPPCPTREATDSAAYRRVKKRQIREFLRNLQNASADDAGASASRVVQGFARIAFFDLRQLFDDKGRIRLPHEWSDAVAAGILSVKSEELFETVTGIDPESGKPVKRKELVGYAREVKRVPPTESLKLLAQMRGLVGQDADAGKGAPAQGNSIVVELGPEDVQPPVEGVP